MDYILPAIGYRNHISYCKIYQEVIQGVNNKDERDKFMATTSTKEKYGKLPDQ